MPQEIPEELTRPIADPRCGVPPIAGNDEEPSVRSQETRDFAEVLVDILTWKAVQAAAIEDERGVAGREGDSSSVRSEVDRVRRRLETRLGQWRERHVEADRDGEVLCEEGRDLPATTADVDRTARRKIGSLHKLDELRLGLVPEPAEVSGAPGPPLLPLLVGHRRDRTDGL